MASGWLMQHCDKNRWTPAELAERCNHRLRAPGEDEPDLHDEASIRRLDACECGPLTPLHYKALGEVLGVGGVDLVDAHGRSLRGCGHRHAQEWAAEAARVSRDLWQEERFQTVDSAALEAALLRCAETGLVDGLARRPGGLPDAARQARHLADLLSQDRKEEFLNLTRIPLRDAIAGVKAIEAGDAARASRQREALHELLLTVLSQCAAQDPAIACGEPYALAGAPRAWQMRAMLDRSFGLDGMRRVRTDPTAPTLALDDGPASTYATRSGHNAHGDGEAQRRVCELVCVIAERFPRDVKLPKPKADHGKEFDAYCEQVNLALESHNDDDEHAFHILELMTMEADAVVEGLVAKLSNLRMFRCLGDLGRRPLLRVDKINLERWIAQHLVDLQPTLDNAGRDLARREQSDTKSPTETQHMPGKKTEPSAPRVEVHNHGPVGAQTFGPKSPGVEVKDNANFNQLNAADARRALPEQLQQLLDGTDPGNPEHVPLRNAIRALQGEIETPPGALSRPAFERFEQARQGIDLGANLTGIAANIAALIAAAGIAV